MPAGDARGCSSQRVSAREGHLHVHVADVRPRHRASTSSTTSDPSLCTSSTWPPRAGDFSGSALFAYKLNWQSVMFVGYGDDRELSDADRLEPLDRQFFVKLSYAFQR